MRTGTTVQYRCTQVSVHTHTHTQVLKVLKVLKLFAPHFRPV
jgi:hypothetical protein